MPRRRTARRRPLTLVEIFVVIAICGILLSIVGQSLSRKRTQREAAPQVARLPEELQPPAPARPSGGLGTLFFGFALGVGATLLYQHWRARKGPPQAGATRKDGTPEKVEDSSFH